MCEGAVGGVSGAEISQYQVVMKQLGKRDATTKLKVRHSTMETSSTADTHY